MNIVIIIRESFEPVNFYDLTYNFKDPRIHSVNLSKFKGPIHNFKRVYSGYITLEDECRKKANRI